jgi:hypothetical protein
MILQAKTTLARDNKTMAQTKHKDPSQDIEM